MLGFLLGVSLMFNIIFIACHKAVMKNIKNDIEKFKKEYKGDK